MHLSVHGGFLGGVDLSFLCKDDVHASEEVPWFVNAPLGQPQYSRLGLQPRHLIGESNV